MEYADLFPHNEEYSGNDVVLPEDKLVCPECGANHEHIYHVHAYDVDEDGDYDTFNDPDQFKLCMACLAIFKLEEDV